MLRLADNLKLPIDVVTQTMAILAKRRAGKSYTMRRLVEQLARAGQQTVLVDPKGDQHGIRSSADGKGPGLPFVILGGEHGDVPLEASSGEVVAKLVVEERVSAVLDLSLFRKHEVATFMTGFLENLYRLKAREIYRTPMMLVIDEADAVAPQKPQKGEERMLGAAEDIVRRGGQRGIGCCLVSQRSAVLNKNVLTQAQILVALRTIAPQDLDAMKAWIDVHGTEEERRTLMESLPSLPVGDAWFWSPGWPTVDGIFERVHVSPIETFDSGATPKPGEKRREPKTVADVDLEALKRQMSATIEKAKADDPRELRKQIEALKRDLAHQKAAVVNTPAAPAHKTVEKPVITDAQLAKAEALVAKLNAAIERAGDVIAKPASALLRQMQELVTAVKAVRQPPLPLPAASRPPVPRRQVPPTASNRQPARPSHASAGDISPKAQQILDSLAELELLGAKTPRRSLVALMAGYTNLTSKGFVNALSALSSGGYVDYPSSGEVALTDSGRAVAVYPSAPRSPEDVQDRVVSLLGGATGKILRPIIDAYPNDIERTAAADAAGYTNLTSKGFVNALSRLSSLGFVTYPSTGRVKAAPVLFLEGR